VDISVAFLLSTLQVVYLPIILSKEAMLTWPIGSNRCSSLSSAPRALRLSNVRRRSSQHKIPTFQHNTANFHLGDFHPTLARRLTHTALDRKVDFLVVPGVLVPSREDLATACLRALMDLLLQAGSLQVLQVKDLISHQGRFHHKCRLDNPASRIHTRINRRWKRKALHRVDRL
jgi:hypothetical protein